MYRHEKRQHVMNCDSEAHLRVTRAEEGEDNKRNRTED